MPSRNGEQNKKSEFSVYTTGNISFNHQVDSLLQLFVKKANCNDCYYEMYIYKRDVDETSITLRASLNYPKEENDNKDLLKDYFKTKTPVLYTKVGHIIVYIYTGIEDLSVIHSISDDLKMEKGKSTYYEYNWLIKIKDGKCHVYEDTWEIPFEKGEFRGVLKFVSPDSITHSR